MQADKQPAGVPARGYWLNFSPRPGAITHEFCGSNAIPGAQCPNCNKPLLKLASFRASDPALALDSARLSSLPLLYCWTCAIPYGEFRYKVIPDGSIRILTFMGSYEDAFGPEGPYDGYTAQFQPREINLLPQSLDEERSLESRFRDADRDLPDELAYPRHQVGGFPMIYNPQSDNCPECGEEMPLFASIADNASGNGEATTTENSFVDNSGVQTVFLFCRSCSVVSAFHSCD